MDRDKDSFRTVSRLEIVGTGRRRRFSDEAKLRIVEEGFSGDGRQVSATALIDDGRKFVDSVAKVAAEKFEGRLVAHLTVGEPGREILQLANDLEADMIVVGTHAKKAIERMLVGSVSVSVVKKAHCPVVVARPKDYAAGEERNETREIAEKVPEIEPPCPKCVETQRATKGRELWCEAHAGRHAHARLHYETPPAFGLGSMFIRADRM